MESLNVALGVMAFVCALVGYAVASAVAGFKINALKREQAEASKRWASEYAALQGRYYRLLYKDQPSDPPKSWVPGTTYTQKQWDAMMAKPTGSYPPGPELPNSQNI